MNSQIERMAREFFGFGRWEAPYWFIGPEQGGNDNPKRAAAFIALQERKSTPDGLCDCKEFHRKIDECRWHFKQPLELQWTWKRLMLLLMAYLREPCDDGSLRRYQRDSWGADKGETCVIELSGLSFKSLRESGKFHAGSDEIEALHKIRENRVKAIEEKLKTVGKEPELVVVYGYSHEKFWKQIIEIDLPRDSVKKHGKTVFVFGPHPAAYGKHIDNSDETWRELGQYARELMQ